MKTSFLCSNKGQLPECHSVLTPGPDSVLYYFFFLKTDSVDYIVSSCHNVRHLYALHTNTQRGREREEVCGEYGYMRGDDEDERVREKE